MIMQGEWKMDNNENDILKAPLKTEDNIEKTYKKYEMTLPKQFRSVFFSAFVSSAVMLLIGFFALLSIFDTEGTKPGALQIICSAVMMLIQFFVIYSSAYNVGEHDTKSFSKLRPYKAKGLVLCIPVLAVTLILFTAYKLIWTYMGTDTIEHGIASDILTSKGMTAFSAWFDSNKPIRVLNGYGAMIVNFLYIMWIFPFYGIIMPVQGYANAVGAVLSFLVPAAAGFTGYIAGCKRFDISYALKNVIYEKNK